MYIQLRRQATPADSTPPRPAITTSSPSTRPSRPSSARNGNQNNMHYHHHNHHHLECPLHQQQRILSQLDLRKKDIKHPELSNIQQLAKFVVNSEPKFEEWKNQEIRVKSLPTDDDFRTARIDLNKGIQRILGSFSPSTPHS